jgi:hypothetical protein
MACTLQAYLTEVVFLVFLFGVFTLFFYLQLSPKGSCNGGKYKK